MSTTPAPVEYTSFFALGQSAYGTPSSPANANALNLISGTIKEEGVRGIPRTAQGMGGAQAPIQGPRYLALTLTASWYMPQTVGDITSMQNHVLWKASPFDITDILTTSSTMAPKRSMVPITDWTPTTITGQTPNGMSKTANNVMLVPTKIDSTGGSIITVEFMGIGTWTADAAATLTAPVLAADLPIVAMNGCIVDGIVADDPEFGFILETGLSIKPSRSSCGVEGQGYPILSSDAPAVLTYPVIATLPYETARAAGASHVVTATWGNLVFNFPDATILNLEDSETDGVQTYDVIMHLRRTVATPEWNVVMT